MKNGEQANRGTETVEAARPKRQSRRMALLKRAGLFCELPPEIIVTRASTFDDLRDAYKLVHEVFLEEGYIRPFPGGLRIRPFEAMPDTATFMAKNDQKVVGVQSLILDSEDLGVPSDRAFQAELDSLRQEGRHVCEAANETVNSDYRRSAVPTELMRCCFAQALSIGATDLFTAISAGHARFYELMGFEKFSPIRSFSEQLDDPVLLVRLDLTTLKKRIENVDGDEEAFLVKYYVNDNIYHRRVETWSIMAEKLFQDPLLLRSLFLDLSSLLSRCNQKELQAICNAWTPELFQEVQGKTVEPSSQHSSLRKRERLQHPIARRLSGKQFRSGTWRTSDVGEEDTDP